MDQSSQTDDFRMKQVMDVMNADYPEIILANKRPSSKGTQTASINYVQSLPFHADLADITFDINDDVEEMVYPESILLYNGKPGVMCYSEEQGNVCILLAKQNSELYKIVSVQYQAEMVPKNIDHSAPLTVEKSAPHKSKPTRTTKRRRTKSKSEKEVLMRFVDIVLENAKIDGDVVANEKKKAEETQAGTSTDGAPLLECDESMDTKSQDEASEHGNGPIKTAMPVPAEPVTPSKVVQVKVTGLPNAPKMQQVTPALTPAQRQKIVCKQVQGSKSAAVNVMSKQMAASKPPDKDQQTASTEPVTKTTEQTTIMTSLTTPERKIHLKKMDSSQTLVSKSVATPPSADLDRQKLETIRLQVPEAGNKTGNVIKITDVRSLSPARRTSLVGKTVSPSSRVQRSMLSSKHDVEYLDSASPVLVKPAYDNLGASDVGHFTSMNLMFPDNPAAESESDQMVAQTEVVSSAMADNRYDDDFDVTFDDDYASLDQTTSPMTSGLDRQPNLAGGDNKSGKIVLTVKSTAPTEMDYITNRKLFEAQKEKIIRKRMRQDIDPGSYSVTADGDVLQNVIGQTGFVLTKAMSKEVQICLSSNININAPYTIVATARPDDPLNPYDCDYSSWMMRELVKPNKKAADIVEFEPRDRSVLQIKPPPDAKGHRYFMKTTYFSIPTLCLICGFNTKDRDRMVVHLNKHKASFKCAFCDFATLVVLNMVKHVRQNHFKYNCQYCNKEYDELTKITKHEVNHQKNKCMLCNHYSTYHGLNQHMREAHPNHPAGVLYICDVCGFRVTNSTALASHMNSQHNIKSKVQELDWKTMFIETKLNLSKKGPWNYQSVKPIEQKLTCTKPPEVKPGPSVQPPSSYYDYPYAGMVDDEEGAKPHEENAAPSIQPPGSYYASMVEDEKGQAS